MSRFVEIRCAHCGSLSRKAVGAVNRAKKIDAPLYCDLRCVGFARRTNRSDEEKKALKAAYDRERRAVLGDSLREEKRTAYYANHAENLAKQRTRRAQLYADPVALADYRETLKEIRSRPEWKKHKRQYDRRYRAEKMVGPEWADSYLALLDLENEFDKMVPNRMDLHVMKGTLNKAQTRKRGYYACRMSI